MSPSAKFFYNDNIKKYKYDLNLAKKILKEAGYVDRDKDGFVEDKRGNKIKFSIVTNAENLERQQMGTIIVNDLRKIGLDVNLSTLDFNTLCAKIDNGDFACVLLGLTGDIEPHTGKNVWTIAGHLHMWNQKPTDKKDIIKWKKNVPEWEKEVDKIFNLGVQFLDNNKRKKLYDKWQELVAANLP
jgi:peptide/nickel transport system substrate-binding protein